MSTAAKHYEELLAEHYLWMFGVSFEEKVAEQRALLKEILEALRPAAPRGAALDLGSGPGFQAIALAELGYSPVIAVDSSRELLVELTARKGSHPIESREADLMALRSVEFREKAAVIVCMGDTLTHLPSREAVREFFGVVFERLAPDGVFVITYRDLTSERTGLDRFLLVRADETKILTCFLEYKDEESVVVHDLLHVRAGNGWQLKKGSYEKCRLPSTWVKEALGSAGFRVERDEVTAQGMVLIAARLDDTIT